MRRRAYAVAAMTMGVVAATACSVLVSLDAVQCTTSADCASRLPGGVCVDSVCSRGATSTDSGADAAVDAADASVADASDGAIDPWRCVGSPSEQLNPNAQLDLAVVAFNALEPITTQGANGGSDLDVISASFLPGVAIRPCNLLDTPCMMPVTPSQTTDDGGNAPFVLPGNFAGYFEMTQSALFPAIFFPGNPLADASMPSDPVPLLPFAGAQNLATTLDVTLETDPEAGVGLVFFLIYDCDDRHAAGVSFSLGDASPDGAVFWYDSNGIPYKTATVTDSLGAAGVVNYPAGVIQIVATEFATGRQLATATAFIRPATSTIAWLRVRTH
jgi:hypothetical protein